ncbi:hypothetical protein DUNSADRAFT_16876, partial [Dunaliella salina]
MPSRNEPLSWLGSNSSASSDYYQFKHLRIRWVTALWGALAYHAYGLFSIQMLARLLENNGNGKRAAAADAVFSIALSLSGGAVTVSAVWSQAASVSRCCWAGGFLCSTWYTLALFLPVCRSELEVLTTISFAAAALVYVPMPGLLLGTHAAAMSCYFIGVGYSKQTSIMRALIVHGIAAGVYALVECWCWKLYKASKVHHHHQQQQQQQKQQQQNSAQQQVELSSDQQLPQDAARHSPPESQGPSPAAAQTRENKNAEGVTARKQEAALRRAFFLQSVPESSQPSSSPPLLRHSNSLESSVNRYETESVWALLSPTPFLSLQGWNINMQSEEGRRSGKHLPWRSASSVSDLGEPLSEMHHSEPPNPPPLAATSAAQHEGSSESTPDGPALPVDTQLRVQVKRVHESSSGTGTPATAAAAALQGCQSSEVGNTLHPVGSLEGCGSVRAMRGARQEAWLNSQESAPPPVSDSSLMRASSGALELGAEAPVHGESRKVAPAHSFSQPAPAPAPQRSLLPSLSPQQQQQQQQKQQCERFSHCMASAWEVGGGFNRDGTLKGAPKPPPTISAVSPMVTHPADGCVMLRVVGAGLGQPGVELRARMHGMYFPVRMAHVWWSAGEGGPAAAATLGFRQSRSLELTRRSSSDMAGELLHGTSRSQLPLVLDSPGHGGEHAVQHRSDPLSPPLPKMSPVGGQRGRWGRGNPGQQGGQQQGQGGLESALITISGLKASSSGSSCSSTFRGLLTLECQVNGTLSSSRPVLVLADEVDGRVESELLAAFAADSCGYTMEALAQEQEAPERMCFNNCSGAYSKSDLSEDMLGSRSSLGKVGSGDDGRFRSGSGAILHQGAPAAEDSGGDPGGAGNSPGGDGREDKEGEGDNVGDSWMADFVSDLGFWLECIDMLDEQHAAAAESRGSNRSSLGGRPGRGLCEKALQESRTAASSDGPDYTELLPMLRGHPVPRAVLVMVGTQLLASALEQAMRALASRLTQGLVKTLGIREEQVCTSLRTVSGGWSVLHCAVRSQDLPTLEVALSLCGPNPTRAWLSDAAPAAPCCTPLHMAAVLPDGGELATAILARNPEVQPLWLGLPLEQPPPSPLLSQQHGQKPKQQHQLSPQQEQQQRKAHGGELTASSTLTSPSTYGGFEGSGTSSSISPGAVSTPGISVYSGQSCALHTERDSAGGSAGSAVPSPAAGTTSTATESVKATAGAASTAATSSHTGGAARVLLDPRPGSPAALAAACGNWVRTAWAHSATLTAPSSIVAGNGGSALGASTAGGAAPPSSILLQQQQRQQQQTTQPVSSHVPGALHTLAPGAPALRSPTAFPAEINADDEHLFPPVPILHAPPVSRGGSKHSSLPNTPSAAREADAAGANPDDVTPWPETPEPTHSLSGSAQAFLDDQPAARTLISLVCSIVKWVVAGLAQLAARKTVPQRVSWLGVDARRLWSWTKLLCMGFTEQEDAVVL